MVLAITATALLGSSSAATPITNFVDVSTDDWFFSYVEFTLERGFFDGVSETEFAPNESITRAMFVTALWRLHSINNEQLTMNNVGEVLQNPQNRIEFYDVAQDAWYSEAIDWASTNQLIFGVVEGIFAPHDELTREQMATIIYRYQRFSDTILPDITAGGEFYDWYDTSPSGKHGVERITAQGIMHGHYDGTFGPRGSVTRAEVAAVMMRLTEIY